MSSHGTPLPAELSTLSARNLSDDAATGAAAVGLPVDWHYIAKTAGIYLALFVALLPALIGWRITPTAAVVLGVPVLLVFFVDRSAFPSVAWHGLAFLAFTYLRVFADDTSMPWQAGYVIELDRVLGLGRNPTELLQTVRGPVLDWIACWTYISFYFTPFVFALLVWWRKAGLGRYVAAFSLAYALGLCLFYALPTVPPWMASAQGLIPPIDRIFMDVMAPEVPQIMEAGYSASANDVAAMPSMHMAMTALAALGLALAGRGAAVAAVLYAGAMFLSIIYLGEHYAADAIAGVVLALGAWWAAGRFVAWWNGTSRAATAAGEPSL